MKVLNQEVNEDFAIYNGDSAEVLKGIPDNSLHYSIFSPPFADLFVYSNSDRDMGNNTNQDDFETHFKFMVEELHRALMKGRLVSVHCMNLPTSKQRDGFIGIKDFRGDIIRLFQDVGFVFHSEVVIWKDPVVAQQRTKALGLLHKTIVKDSSMSRMGIPDYIVTFRKLGDNPEPISGGFEYYNGDEKLDIKDGEGFNAENGRLNRGSIATWQKYASPVWMDIKQGNTLNFRAAKEKDDEKHICPLQLDVIERCLQLWTNPGDTVFTPFLGVGSEVYQALMMNRKGIGIELKESYFNQAKLNCERALIDRKNSQGLF